MADYFDTLTNPQAADSQEPAGGVKTATLPEKPAAPDYFASIGMPARNPADDPAKLTRAAATLGLSWESTQRNLKKAYPDVDPDALKQNFDLDVARKEQQGKGYGEGEAGSIRQAVTGTAEAYQKNFMPFGGFFDATGTKAYGEAKLRFDAGKASPDDIKTMARYERVEEMKKQTGDTVPGALVNILGGASQAVTELGAAGKALGLASKAPVVGGALRAVGFGAPASTPLIAAMNPTTVRGAANFLARGAPMTALAPSFYVEKAQQKNISEGRAPDDWRGYPAAVGLAYANILVLGQAQKFVTNPAGSALGRFAARGGQAGSYAGGGLTGIVEQQGVEGAAGAIDEFLPKAWKTDTKYGLIGNMARGEHGEAAKHAATQFLTFAGFAAMHGRPTKPVTEAFQKAMDTAGPEATAQAQKTVADAVAAKPDLTQAEAKPLIEAVPEGPARTLAETIVEATLPKSAEAPTPQPEVAPPTETPSGSVSTPEPADRYTKDELTAAAKPIGLSEKALRNKIGEPWAQKLLDAAYPEKAQKALPSPAAPPPAPEPARPEIAPPAPSVEDAPPVLSRRDRIARLGQKPAPKPAELPDLIKSAGLEGKADQRAADLVATEGVETSILRYGDRFVRVDLDPAANRIKLGFGFETERAGQGELDPVKLGRTEGTATLFNDLGKIAGAAKARGAEISYTAEPRRARVYAKGLERAGYEPAVKTELDGGKAEYVWKPAAEKAAKGGSVSTPAPVPAAEPAPAAKPVNPLLGRLLAKQAGKVTPSVPAAEARGGRPEVVKPRADAAEPTGENFFREVGEDATPVEEGVRQNATVAEREKLGEKRVENWEKPGLSDVERNIIRYREQDGLSLREMQRQGKIINPKTGKPYTYERVRQLEKIALEKIGNDKSIAAAAEEEAAYRQLDQLGKKKLTDPAEISKDPDAAGRAIRDKQQDILEVRDSLLDDLLEQAAEMKAQGMSQKAIDRLWAEANPALEQTLEELRRGRPTKERGRKIFGDRREAQGRELDAAEAQAAQEAKRRAARNSPAGLRARAKAEESAADLTNVVKSFGGIDPTDAAFLAHFEGKKEGVQSLDKRVFRSKEAGGRALDDLATDMHLTGHIEDARPQTLIDALLEGRRSRADDNLDASHQLKYEEFERQRAEEGQVDYSLREGDANEPSGIADAGFDPAALEGEGFGKPLSWEERNIGQIGGGQENAPADGPTAQRLRETAIANARIDAERAEHKLPPLMSEARRANTEVWDKAMRKLADDPSIDRRLVDELTKQTRPTSDQENALLLHRDIALNNEYERTIRQAVGKTFGPNKDIPEFDRLNARADELLGEIDKLHKVSRSTGTEWGRSGQFRQQLAKEDFSLSRMRLEAERAKKAPLTLEEKADIDKLHAEITDLRKKLAEAEDAAKPAPVPKPDPSKPTPREPAPPEPGQPPSKARSIYERVRDYVAGIFAKPDSGQRSRAWEYADRMERESVAEISKKIGGDIGFSGFDPTLIVPISKYVAAKVIKTGLTFADFTKGMVNKFGDDVKPHLTEIWNRAQEHVKASDPTPKATSQVIEARINLNTKKREYKTRIDKFERGSRTTSSKVFQGAGEGASAARALQTSFDLSSVFRQGDFLTLGHPIKAARAFRGAIGDMLSERNFERNEEYLKERDNYKSGLDKQAGLEFTERYGNLNGQEEGFMSRLLGAEPNWKDKRAFPLNVARAGVRISERGFIGFLNRMRAEVFDSLVANNTRGGVPTTTDAKALANLVNVTTGRAKLGKKVQDAMPLAVQLLFSPKYVISRFQVLSGQPFWGGSWRTRQQILTEYVRAAAGLGLVYALAKAAAPDTEVTFDPRSSDFGKIKMGTYRLDPLGGLAQATTFLGRMLGGETMDEKGRVEPLRGPGAKDWAGSKVILNFLRSKLAPVPSVAVDVLTGKDMGYKLATPVNEGGHLVRPMSTRDLEDIWKEFGRQNVPRALALSLLTILGMGSQLHEREERPDPRKANTLPTFSDVRKRLGMR